MDDDPIILLHMPEGLGRNVREYILANRNRGWSRAILRRAGINYGIGSLRWVDHKLSPEGRAELEAFVDRVLDELC